MVNPKEEKKKVKNPYPYNFVKMAHPEIGTQNEPFSDRLKRYMNKYTLTAKRFAELSEEYAGPHGTKVTESDINGYLYYGWSPKIDKLYAITQVMGVTIDYFCGYGPRNRRSKNPIIEARYRKRKRDN